MNPRHSGCVSGIAPFPIRVVTTKAGIVSANFLSSLLALDSIEDRTTKVGNPNRKKYRKKVIYY